MVEKLDERARRQIALAYLGAAHLKHDVREAPSGRVLPARPRQTCELRRNRSADQLAEAVRNKLTVCQSQLNQRLRCETSGHFGTPSCTTGLVSEAVWRPVPGGPLAVVVSPRPNLSSRPCGRLRRSPARELNEDVGLTCLGYGDCSETYSAGVYMPVKLPTVLRQRCGRAPGRGQPSEDEGTLAQALPTHQRAEVDMRQGNASCHRLALDLAPLAPMLPCGARDALRMAL